MKYQKTGKLIKILITALMVFIIFPASISSEETNKGLDITGRIFLVLDIPESEIYVNEKVPVKLEFYSDWLDVENLTLQDPVNKGLIAGKFIKGDTRIIEREGIKYVVVEFDKSFFAPEPGEFIFEAVKARCNVSRRKGKAGKKDTGLLNDNEDFYDRFLGRRKSRKIELSTKPYPIKVLPLPLKGRPASFNGAVGAFTVDSKADWSNFDRDNIVRIFTRITGQGNYNTVRMPDIPEMNGLSLYDSRAEKSDAGVVFEQILKIEPEKVKRIPAIEFTFFDPERRIYFTFKEGPFDVEGKVKPPIKEVEKPLPKKKKEPPKEWVVSLKNKPGRFYKDTPAFYKSGTFILFLIFPIVLLAASLVVHRRIWILTSDSEYAVFFRASNNAKHSLSTAKTLMEQGKAVEFYGLAFNMLQEYLGERFSLPLGSITETDVDGFMGSKKDLKGISEKIKSVFADCYIARYTLLDISREDMAGTYKKLQEIIDYLNEKRYLITK